MCQCQSLVSAHSAGSQVTPTADKPMTEVETEIKAAATELK